MRGFPLMGRHSEMTRFRMGATRLQMPLDEYIAKREAGLHWCSGHQCWEPREGFVRHPNRADGIAGQCVEWNREYSREYQRRKRGAA